MADHFLLSEPREACVAREKRGDIWEGRDMKTFINLLKDQSGASAAEYALILAIVGSALAIAAIGLGNTISTSMNTQASRITDCTDGTC
jgi:pilus assembly protein Flp/PilA